MSHDRREGYAGKHPASSVPDEDVVRALSEKIKNGRVSCAAAHGVAQMLAPAILAEHRR